MSNEKLARGRAENTARLRRWAESVLAMPAGHHDEDVLAAAEHILATTSEPTMADVEWDDEKHRLAGADWNGAPVVMLDTAEDATIYALEVSGKAMWEILRSRLTPNGKRYELREAGTVKESLIVHPETLTTLEDYENAPEGTIVALNGCLPYVKRGRNDWSDAFGDTCSDKGIAGHTREVLRWGWDA